MYLYVEMTEKNFKGNKNSQSENFKFEGKKMLRW